MRTEKKNLKIMWIATSLILVLVLVLMTIRMVRENNQFKIVNFDQIKSNLSDANKDGVKEEILAKIKNEKVGDGMGAEGLIRVSSYEEEKVENGRVYKFLVDIDKYKVSYAVDFIVDNNTKKYEEINLSCPSFKELKYPENDCAGEDNEIQAIERYLPYNFEMESGRVVTITSEYSNEKKNYLKVRVSTCGREGVVFNTIEAVNEWIGSLGFNPDKFEIEIEEFCDVS
ncbi:hypothetical protein IKG33_03310 [Candidatus Saccharibacteria bacterium]|nr:hypothetical protein [Candidatus Saccharibacteria bacterium]